VVSDSHVIRDATGTGIFLVPARWHGLSAPQLVFVAWIIGGSQCFSVLFVMPSWARHFRKPGPYVYLSRGLGPLWGFLFAWMSSLLVRPAGMATLATGFVRFLGFLFPIVATPLFTTQLGG
jgi:APA family basic amino acid/polyamine antiporter